MMSAWATQLQCIPNWSLQAIVQITASSESHPGPRECGGDAAVSCIPRRLMENGDIQISSKLC
jgi:hypothetical protein